MPKNIDMPSEQKAQFLMDVVEDRKAVDPTLLDLRKTTMMFDFFLVCSGMSDVHIRAIADAVMEKAKEQRVGTPHIEGLNVGEWVLLDFGDVILHVMNEESRDRYKLEKFWTTPQPHGAVPPTPNSAANLLGEERVKDEEYELSDEDLEALEADDDEDDEDAAFFAEADTEVAPIDEEELDDEDDEDEEDDESGPPNGKSSEKS